METSIRSHVSERRARVSVTGALDLATRDRLLAEIERLNVEIVALRGTPIGRQPASATSAAEAPSPSVGLSPAVEPSPVTAQAPSPVPSAPIT